MVHPLQIDRSEKSDNKTNTTPDVTKKEIGVGSVMFEIPENKPVSWTFVISSICSSFLEKQTLKI